MAAARVPAGALNAAYSVDRVSMEYRSRRNARPTDALRNVTLRVARGELVAIVGRSGSGKSSLLQLLAGLDVPTAGSIVCRPNSDDEYTLHEMSEDARATFRGAHVGFVFQAFHLLPALTAWENAAVPLLFAGVPLQKRREDAHELLEDLGMSSLAERYPYELSGGEQQRVAIARALANDPAVLLADEPTGNLDSASAKRVVEMIRRAHQTRDLTTVLVTHDHDLANDLGARIVELQDGTVVRA